MREFNTNQARYIPRHALSHWKAQDLLTPRV